MNLLAFGQGGAALATNLVEDYQLVPHHVQQLARADAVAAFFAMLGYDTSARLPQTAAALGITAESLQRKIRRLERLADQEAGALQVYLVELDSVTVAATQGLARALRNRAGNYLLVLTSDYETLDFVLLEREVALVPATSLAAPRVTVRPRVLTVTRRDPGAVALRVLRRFTHIEVDADAQYDKLLSAYTIAEWSEEHFNNRALFADYFLKERLPALPEWAEDAKPAFQRLRALYADARERFGGADEATVRRELIEPALETLGFAMEAATGRRGDAERDALSLIPVSPGQRGAASENALRVACLSYPWDRYLDGKDEQRDSRRPDENPGARVVSVLEVGGAPWAIVTNGKLQRL